MRQALLLSPSYTDAQNNKACKEQSGISIQVICLQNGCLPIMQYCLPSWGGHCPRNSLLLSRSFWWLDMSSNELKSSLISLPVKASRVIRMFNLSVAKNLFLGIEICPSRLNSCHFSLSFLCLAVTSWCIFLLLQVLSVCNYYCICVFGDFFFFHHRSRT